MSTKKLFLIVFPLFLGCLFSCQTKTKNWDNITKSVEKWSSFDLQIKGVKAAFPERPVSKTIAYSDAVNFYQNYAESDTVTYSVALITNKSLKDSEAWNNFLRKEVLAFKALEQKNIKIQGRDAILSKVRENELCSYTINMIVDNKFVANIGIRYKGAFPPEKLIMAFAAKVRF
jgi:hypothetical protein